MNIRRINLLAVFELQRLFATRRGIISLVTFVLVWYAILRYAVAEAVVFASDPNFKGFIDSFLGSVGAYGITQWKEIELAVYLMFSIFFFPLFVVLSSADQTVEDRTRGTLRFLSLRATRDEIVLGRFLGQTLNTLLLITLSALGTWLLMIIREPSLAIPGVVKAIALSLELTLIVMPFIAYMSLVNNFSNSSKMSMVNAILIYLLFSGVTVSIADHVPVVIELLHVMPGFQIDETVRLSNNSARFVIPLLQTIGFLLISTLLLRRRAL
ncbi:ABC transporter permease subunit [Pseudoalteromonas sp. T1lg65]|uniref:ABC transporter permease subunit n=1 Tax=Pseudoalteromonas sp. T1lg65 TaxID=2077101 RepID=UPI003F7A22B0